MSATRAEQRALVLAAKSMGATFNHRKLRRGNMQNRVTNKSWRVCWVDVLGKKPSFAAGPFDRKYEAALAFMKWSLVNL